MNDKGAPPPYTHTTGPFPPRDFPPSYSAPYPPFQPPQGSPYSAYPATKPYPSDPVYPGSSLYPTGPQPASVPVYGSYGAYPFPVQTAPISPQGMMYPTSSVNSVIAVPGVHFDGGARFTPQCPPVIPPPPPGCPPNVAQQLSQAGYNVQVSQSRHSKDGGWTFW